MYFRSQGVSSKGSESWRFERTLELAAALCCLGSKRTLAIVRCSVALPLRGSRVVVSHRLKGGGYPLERRFLEESHEPYVDHIRGVFGIALGVSTKFVFLFVLFGALLDKAGAGIISSKWRSAPWAP